VNDQDNDNDDEDDDVDNDEDDDDDDDDAVKKTTTYFIEREATKENVSYFFSKWIASIAYLV